MGLADFSLVKRIFGGSKASEEEQRELFRQTLILTLSRATSADQYIEHAEVDTVKKILKQHLGEDLDAGEIRVAARSDLFEAQPLDRTLNQVGGQLSLSHRIEIARALIEVIRVDGHLRSREADFFNMVAQALGLTPIDIVDAASKG
jgi:uncharacterized tellurite resistance protein B-like protein